MSKSIYDITLILADTLEDIEEGRFVQAHQVLNDLYKQLIPIAIRPAGQKQIGKKHVNRTESEPN